MHIMRRVTNVGIINDFFFRNAFFKKLFKNSLNNEELKLVNINTSKT